MAITYPLQIPETIGIETIELRTASATSLSESPFTFSQQVFAHAGQRWEASVSIPPVRKDLAAEWKAFLAALNGRQGTFLLQDPDYDSPRGTVSGTITGSGTAGNNFISVTMTGSLLAGDYINLGGDTVNAKLHMVTEDLTGNGNLYIWPDVRVTFSSDPVYYENPKGLFRLASNVSSWQINNASAYGLSFDCVEAI